MFENCGNACKKEEGTHVSLLFFLVILGVWGPFRLSGASYVFLAYLLRIITYHVSRIAQTPPRITYRVLLVFQGIVSRVSRINVFTCSRVHVFAYRVLTYHVSCITKSMILVLRIGSY